MNHYEFLINVLYQNWELYIVSLIAVGSIYYPIIKHISLSFIDPIFIALIGDAFASTIPVFLFITGNCSYNTFIYFCVCQIVFFGSYFIFRKPSTSFKKYRIVEENISNVGYVFFLGIYIASNLLTYILLGIPLFKESRLETYSGSGGLGILSYFTGIALFYCCVYLFYLLKKKRWTLLAKLNIVLIAIFSILSGSKGSILIILYGYFFYKYYYLNQKIKFKDIKKYLPVILLFPIVMIVINSGNGLMAFLDFGIRLVAYGDIYWEAFPNGTMNSINIDSPAYYIFGPILAPFRLIDGSMVEPPIGAQLNWIVSPAENGIMKGPNTRLSVLCWIIFKNYGIIIASLFGIFFAYWNTRLRSKFPRGILPTILYGYIYLGFSSCITDPIMGLGRVFSVTLLFFLLWGLCFVFGGRYLQIKKLV